MAEYGESYDFATGDVEAVRYQAREEIAMRKMMDAEGCTAFSGRFSPSAPCQYPAMIFRGFRSRAPMKPCSRLTPRSPKW